MSSLILKIYMEKVTNSTHLMTSLRTCTQFLDSKLLDWRSACITILDALYLSGHTVPGRGVSSSTPLPQRGSSQCSSSSASELKVQFRRDALESPIVGAFLTCVLLCIPVV